VICQTDKDLQGIMRIGQICGQTLLHMLNHVEPGITTKELDRIGEAFLKKHGATSAPITAYKYPGWTCISLNDAVAHGIPDDTKVKEGDVINIDVSAVLEGYWGDTGATMLVPPETPLMQKITQTAQTALKNGIGAAKAGQPVYEISRAIHDTIKKNKFKTFFELGGHGVGRHIHEKPSIPNHFTKRAKETLVDGLVITIEPFVTNGKGRIFTDDDDWTLRTTDGKLSAQYEHTVIISGDTPILATKVDGTWW